MSTLDPNTEGGNMSNAKRQIDVQIHYRDDLTQINIDLLALDGTALSGQDILDAVAETLLLKWDHYDLESPPTSLDS